METRLSCAGNSSGELFHCGWASRDWDVPHFSSLSKDLHYQSQERVCLCQTSLLGHVAGEFFFHSQHLHVASTFIFLLASQLFIHSTRRSRHRILQVMHLSLANGSRHSADPFETLHFRFLFSTLSAEASIASRNFVNSSNSSLIVWRRRDQSRQEPRVLETFFHYFFLDFKLPFLLRRTLSVSAFILRPYWNGTSRSKARALTIKGRKSTNHNSRIRVTSVAQLAYSYNCAISSAFLLTFVLSEIVLHSCNLMMHEIFTMYWIQHFIGPSGKKPFST